MLGTAESYGAHRLKDPEHFSRKLEIPASKYPFRGYSIPYRKLQQGEPPKSPPEELEQGGVSVDGFSYLDLSIKERTLESHCEVLRPDLRP